MQYPQLEALVRLLQLAQMYELEEGGARAWRNAARAYASRGTEVSPVLLQRRWHQLKRCARDSLAAWWRSRQEPSSTKQPPHRVFQALLTRFLFFRHTSIKQNVFAKFSSV